MDIGIFMVPLGNALMHNDTLGDENVIEVPTTVVTQILVLDSARCDCERTNQ